MAYSTSLSTLRKMQEHLQLLAQGTPCEWRRSRDDAAVWAYKIREALNIAAAESLRRPQDADLKALADAKALFTIQVISPNLVRAVYANVTEIQEEPTASRQALTPSPANRVSQVRSASDIQGVWLSRQPSNDKLHFPDAQLDEAELLLAASWAAGLTPAWMLIRVKGTNALTLAPDDPRVPDEIKIRPRTRAVSADEPPAQLSDKTPTGRAWERAKLPPPPAVEPPDLDNHGGQDE